MNRLIFHIDVNNAFLSWSACEYLKNGFKIDIRNEVSVIAGDKSTRSGIILAKSTPAKKYGIVTAETIDSAKKKYNKLKIYPPDYKIYKKYSMQLYNYLKSLTPLIEQYSVDECYLDFTGITNVEKNPINYGNQIKEYIYNTFGYTVNIGIGNNKLCAKMASDFEKPNKLHTLYDTEIKEKLWPLNISELFMVGRKTTLKLKEMGINTIYDLAHYPKEKLIYLFKKQGYMLIDYSRGIDNSEVINDSDLKCISNSYTYSYNLNNIVDIKNKLFELSTIVGRRIRNINKKAYTITLHIKYTNFNVINKQQKLSNSICKDDDIYNTILLILKKIQIKEIRSLGIKLSDFDNNNIKQVSIFDKVEESKNNYELDYVIDNLKNKYGENIIKRGA